MITPDAAIDQINGRFGQHGARALHAKGTLCSAVFSATPEAARLCRSPLLGGDPVPAVVRFSNGSGNPHHPDNVPDARGMAVKFTLPDGSTTDIVAQSAPRFPVATPDAFMEFLRKLQPAGLLGLPAFLLRHPSAAASLPANARALQPPVSFAGIPYWAIHAYRWLSDDGSRFVRYQFVPETSLGHLKPWEGRRRDRDYLHNDITTRVMDGTVRFTLRVQIAEDGDDVNDASKNWPRSRRTVDVGILEIHGLDETRERDGDVLVFDPTRVCEGIELSDDPVLHFRRKAYSASVSRRT